MADSSVIALFVAVRLPFFVLFMKFKGYCDVCYVGFSKFYECKRKSCVKGEQ